jgi:hypothetical protein
MLRSILAAAAFVLVLGAYQPAHADVIVINAKGPTARAFSRGDIIPDRTQIILVEGDSLSVMIAGGTQILRGPYVGPVQVTSSRQAPRINFGELFKVRQRTRLAGVRTGD